MQKKEYLSPELTIVNLKSEERLLCSSCEEFDDEFGMNTQQANIMDA